MYVALILQPIVDACHEILKFWHGFIGGSWGWAIIMLTVTVRLAILPLTFKGVKGMQRMQQLQPEIKKIQARYKDDKQRMNQEVMAFYQKEKANPLSACFPLLLQVPFFISLFYLLRSSAFKADIAGNAAFGPIDNLAEKVTDPVLLGFLIVLYVGTQLAASMVTMVSGDPNQKRIMYAMPFVFAFFLLNFQAGLIVYWITTNVWTIGQQLVVRKLYPKPEPISSDDDGGAPKPARGKPVPAGAAALTDGGNDAAAAKPAPKRETRAKRKAKATAAADGGGGGNGRTAGAKPPPSPRKKKKRSGRRR